MSSQQQVALYDGSAARLEAVAQAADAVWTRLTIVVPAGDWTGLAADCAWEQAAHLGHRVRLLAEDARVTAVGLRQAAVATEVRLAHRWARLHRLEDALGAAAQLPGDIRPALGRAAREAMSFLPTDRRPTRQDSTHPRVTT